MKPLINETIVELICQCSK